MKKKLTLEDLDKRLKKLEEIQAQHTQASYDFYDIFDYDTHNGLLIPKYDVRMLNKFYKKGQVIRKPNERTWWGRIADYNSDNL